MSYSQFGYTYPSSTQILVSGGGGSQSPCCPPPSADGRGGSPPQVCAAAAYAADSRLLTQIPRLASFGLYAGSSYAEHISTLANNSAFYSTLPSPYDLKESRSTWNAALQQSAACYPYDHIAPCNPYSDRYGSMESVARRKNATRETTNTLKAWLYEHRKNPYPTKGEKIMLAIITKMTLTQVSTWFANARRRLKKENKMTWEPRNKTSEGEDRDSSSPRDLKSDDTTDDCSSLNDFLKQEPGTFSAKDTTYPTEFESGDAQQRSLKSCDSLALDCYRVQSHSSEDSIPSDTSSPARSSCYPGYQQSTKDGPKDTSPGYVASNTPAFDSGNRPKIWSLARTATSNSPPTNRRSLMPCQMDYCLENGSTKVDEVCSPVKLNSCSATAFGEFIPDTRTRDNMCCSTGPSASDLCCNSRPSAYDSILTDCDSASSPKDKDAKCLASSTSRGSCMMENTRPPYSINFPPPSLGENGDHFMYDTKHFKSKVSMGFEGSSLETSAVAPPQNCDISSYSDSEPHSRTELFDSERYAANQCNRPLQKCCSNQSVLPTADLIKSALRHSDQ